jgi:hypothetical protein
MAGRPPGSALVLAVAVLALSVASLAARGPRWATGDPATEVVGIQAVPPSPVPTLRRATALERRIGADRSRARGAVAVALFSVLWLVGVGLTTARPAWFPPCREPSHRRLTVSLRAPPVAALA